MAQAVPFVLMAVQVVMSIAGAVSKSSAAKREASANKKAGQRLIDLGESEKSELLADARALAGATTAGAAGMGVDPSSGSPETIAIHNLRVGARRATEQKNMRIQQSTPFFIAAADAKARANAAVFEGIFGAVKAVASTWAGGAFGSLGGAAAGGGGAAAGGAGTGGSLATSFGGAV